MVEREQELWTHTHKTISSQRGDKVGLFAAVLNDGEISTFLDTERCKYKIHRTV